MLAQVVSAAASRPGAGAWTALGPSNASGIVTFPSFHAALPVIMAYDARRSKLTAAIVWPIATLIVISTPLCGGHYVADTIAGIVVALVAIAAVRAKDSIQLSLSPRWHTEATSQPPIGPS